MTEQTTRENYTWNPVELRLASAQAYVNPYTDVEVNVILTTPQGDQVRAPAFWDGGRTWRVRFAPPLPGDWRWRSEASDTGDTGLHGQTGEFHVLPYSGDNPIYAHGFLGGTGNRRGFAHADGAPFFWLGDTVWSISAKANVEEWEEYIAFRHAQGFNIAQINALPQHDASVSEHRIPFAAGPQRWNLRRPNMEYFQYLDRLMSISSRAGMFTAMVVLWFDYVPGANPTWGGPERVNLFTPELARWYGRYLAARYAAFGTVWLVAGDSDFESPGAIAVYDAAAHAIREASPYPPLRTAHLHGGTFTPENLNAKDWLDFHMYQSSHNPASKQKSLQYAAANRAYQPTRPVLNGEPCYEEIGFHRQPGRVSRELVRKVAWSSILGGGNAGLTYGAHGVWAWHREGEFFRGDELWQAPRPWQEAIKFEGAADVARMKGFFTDLPWWELEPAQHLLASDDEDTVVAATGDQRLVAAYAPQPQAVALHLQGKVTYEGSWFNPVDGQTEASTWSGQDGRIQVKQPTWQGEAVLLLRG